MKRNWAGRGTRHAMVIAAFVAVAAITAGSVLADDEEERVLELGRFYPTLESGFNFTQSAYSDNWSGGDKGSLVWAFITNGTLENQFTPKVNWYNTLKLAYGQTHQQVVDTTASGDFERRWEKPEKSTDLIDYETIFRFTMGWVVDPFVSGRFESQFQDASDLNGRTLTLNPLKFKESGGVAKKFLDKEDRSLLSRFGFTFRQSSRRLFLDQDNVDGLDTETETIATNDGGLEWVTDYKAKILEDRVTWTSKLSLYQPIFFSDKSAIEGLTEDQLVAAGISPDVADYTTTMDVDWENIFTTQITKIISVNLYTRWIYDRFDNSVGADIADDGTLSNPDDIRNAIRGSGQFKQTLGIGLTYRFL